MAVGTLENILRPDLTIDQRRVLVRDIFDMTVGEVPSREQSLVRSKTLGDSKSLLEFYELVRQVIDDMEMRSSVATDYKVLFTEEEPDVNAQTETITFSLVKRDPGAYGQGAPFEAKVRNMRPMIRESGIDPTNPGYRTAVLGYVHDNIVRFTCWARTNKVANTRADWFIELMEDYSWFFKAQGVQRVLFWQQLSDSVLDVSGNRWYGRPIEFFVRTEKLREVNEKKIEEIALKITVAQS